MKTDDPVIDEIRLARHLISERFGHDPALLVEHYIEIQRQQSESMLAAATIELKKANESEA